MAFAVLGDMSLHGLEPATGVEWVVQRDQFSGWDDGPASTVSIQQKARGDGGWTGKPNRKPMHPVLGGFVYAPNEDALDDARDRLKAACTLDLTTLTITRGSRARWTSVQREDEVLFKVLSPTKAAWSIQLVAPDSRKFGATLTDSTALPSTSGGLTIPYTIPYSINSTQVSGQVSLINPGNTPGPVRLRIDGPITGPVVTHVSSGLRLVFAASLTLGVGEFLTVDMESQLVLAQGQSGRANWVTSRGWSQFEPGVNTWAFTAVGYSPDALLTVSADPSWQ